MVLFSHEKEGNPAVCHNLNEIRGHLAKWSKSDRERQILYDSTHMWDLKRTNSEKQSDCQMLKGGEDEERLDEGYTLPGIRLTNLGI